MFETFLYVLRKRSARGEKVASRSERKCSTYFYPPLANAIAIAIGSVMTDVRNASFLVSGTRGNGLIQLKNGVDYINPGEEDQMEIYGWVNVNLFEPSYWPQRLRQPKNWFDLMRFLLFFQLQEESDLHRDHLVPHHHYRWSSTTCISLGTTLDAHVHSFHVPHGRSRYRTSDRKVSGKAHELLRQETQDDDRPRCHVSFSKRFSSRRLSFSVGQ